MAESWFWKKNGVYQLIDTIICCSRFMKTKLDRDPVLRNKTVVLHNFIDDAEKKPVQKQDYVLYFGRFSKEKGIETLLRACAELSDIPFVFAGSGPLEERLNGIANVKNAGFRTGKELEMLIRNARFSVCPSQWYENCPLSVMESQCCQTPVLGANIGGIPELIEAGKTGELFESGNQKELCEKIRMLWNDSDRLTRYRENCADLVFDSVETYTKKLLKLYGGNA
jgi:glycosyltransferase involved in cell wall biosynthesis